MDLKELENGVDPHSHWYYQTKKLPLLRFFKEKVVDPQKKVTVVDIGAGSGFFSLELERVYGKYIENIILVDLYYSDSEILECKDLKIQKQRSVPDDLHHSILLMMDVIEHVEDDGEFLNKILSRFRGENLIYVTVPAFQSLWSGHDVFLGHYRRYSLVKIRILLANSNIGLENYYYQYALIFPIAWILRSWSKKSSVVQNDMRPANPILNFLLKKVLAIEVPFMRYNSFLGLTCTLEGYFSESLPN